MDRYLIIMTSLNILLSPALVAQPVSAEGTSGLKEAYTAFRHAEMAYEADNINTAQTNLQEAINCLVGPTDKNFSAVVENPCSGQGNGAIHDIRDVSLRYDLRSALREASLGLKRYELKSVKTETLSVMEYLQSAREDWNFQTPP